MSDLAQEFALKYTPLPPAAAAQGLQWPFGSKARKVAHQNRAGSMEHARAGALSKARQALAVDLCKDADRAAAALLEGVSADIFGARKRRAALCIGALASAILDPGVHLCTKDDAETAVLSELLRPAAEKVGVSVGLITAQSDREARLLAYRAPLTIVCGLELASDVLRDQMALGPNRTPLARKVQRITRGGTAVLIPRLRRLIVSDISGILLGQSRLPVMLHDRVHPTQPPEMLFQAVGLASELVLPRDILRQENAFSFTEAGERRIERSLHLYPALAEAPDMGRKLVLEAATVQWFYQRDQHFSVVEGRVDIHTPNDASFISADDARPYLEVAHGIAPAARMAPVARVRLQRVLARYPVVAGVGVGLRAYRRELRRTYPVSGPLLVGPPAPQVYVRAVTGTRKMIRHIGSMGAVDVMLPDADTEGESMQRLLASEAPMARAVRQKSDRNPAVPLVLLTPAEDRAADIALIEAFSDGVSTIERLVDLRLGATQGIGPRWLCAALVFVPPGSLRNWLVRNCISVSYAMDARKNARARRELVRYDDRLDDLLSFAGEPE